MLVGRLLYLGGLAFSVGSIGVLVLSFLSGGGALVMPLFGALNGLVAMGIGDLVIDSNYKKRVEAEASKERLHEECS